MMSRFARQPGIVVSTNNHYSMPRTVEDMFGLGHLEYAGQDGLTSLGVDAFVSLP
jgi:hypothetical protein